MSLFLRGCYLADREGPPTAVYNPRTGECSGVLTGFAIVPIEDYQRYAAEVQSHAQSAGFGIWSPAGHTSRARDSYTVEDI